ncbi:uncharacterized protein PHACADRAFT_180663 [Phanerochaete carnosa HHB-10118-sp]|uniref:Protein kinase domain-containing protein n=1 Tax=Phanerochaete carnosa (strain HHB-10118-sp) TaxID=650164 RepID=K5VEV0_PHACS|nr:uncharacterized protein PHACADRAFT_180663 [Phanerochaete carnosa HHB-10118-sp]EKM61556.1 hypothetical protein PHACADRAFT_180663 [Phanerochaete carnosa HHB-10118-sp]
MSDTLQTLQTVFNVALNTLEAIPDPISSAITAVVHQIWNAVQQANQNKHQMRVLFQHICELLSSLGSPQNFNDQAIQKAVSVLVRNLENVLKFVVSEQRKTFLKSMLTADDLKLKIEEHQRHISTACLGFQNAALLTANKKLDDLMERLNSHADQQAATAAQQLALQQDMAENLQMLRSAVTSTAFLDELLGTVQADPTHMMTAMQAVLEREESGQTRLRREEIEFLRAGVKRLSVQTQGKKVKIKSWTVTGFEVERGFLLGSDISSTIRVGRWLGKVVSILEMRDIQTTLDFVKLWKSLRSTRIQGMLGASTTDSPPFILLPYAPDNVLDYLIKTPAPDYLRLVSEIARGLDYLHHRDPPVIHGSIRPGVVHVDSQGNVTLSCIAIHRTHLAPMDLATTMKLHNALSPWQAPELPATGPTPAADIYGYGLLLSSMLTILLDKHSSSPFDGEALLRRLIDGCLEPMPEDRSTTSEILQIISATNPVVRDGDMFTAQPSLVVDPLPEGVAEHWRLVPIMRRAYGVVIQNIDAIYLSTAPIDGTSDNPLRRLSFEIRCHDQGEEGTTARPQDGAYAWMEVALCRPTVTESGLKTVHVDFEEECPGAYRGHMIEPTRWEVVRCPFADKAPRTHRINFDHLHPVVRLAKKGDRIHLYPKAL